ncbi:aldose epimerase family protein [Devosia nitrariae]|uniref:Aldose 1-epimerase n=1 Tax=Devosia nitrariae TaxID=2071872 RepID=A0ABQ5W6Z9_9HYPH|nr:aldose epimerase family protein [Devosia nitrariae]GLQ55411.1 aldose 1-epimerase [Devosia nitrariae]
MQAVAIANDALSARIAPFGATLVDLRLSGWPEPLVLGFERHEDYAEADHYAGAVIGRFANRIRHGRAVLDGRPIRLSINGDGHHLHGGGTGAARQSWRLEEADVTRVVLTWLSPDGHEGYPGNCRVRAVYSVLPPATLRLELEATTDKPTFVNLCHHPYFNFSGRPDIFDHHLEIAATHYLVTGPNLIPTGEIRPVGSSPFNFRQLRALGANRPQPGFNNTYRLAEASRAHPTFAARLGLPGGPAMELWTTQPGLHLYDGYKLGSSLVGLGGRIYGPHAGLCLEAQNWPDSPNHGHFPSAVLCPGETYRQVTEYRFTLAR